MHCAGVNTGGLRCGQVKTFMYRASSIKQRGKNLSNFATVLLWIVDAKLDSKWFNGNVVLKRHSRHSLLISRRINRPQWFHWVDVLLWYNTASQHPTLSNSASNSCGMSMKILVNNRFCDPGVSHRSYSNEWLPSSGGDVQRHWFVTELRSNNEVLEELQELGSWAKTY